MDSSSKNFRWLGMDILSRGGLFLIIWWILAGDSAGSWMIGIPAVLLALAVSFAFEPMSAHFRWIEFFRFLPFFFLNSLLGGIDIARRAFHPRLPINPGLIHYPLQLPPGLPQVLMTLIVNLLPGTLVTELKGDLMKVHVLDINKDYFEELGTIQQSVARMFGITNRG